MFFSTKLFYSRTNVEMQEVIFLTAIPICPFRYVEQINKTFLKASRFVRAQREFRQTNKTGLVKRAVGVSISGKNL
uniref:Uncharacterized protein n=1 Tax=Meloidogyne incognita TaxID=6306 RepID=A0A914KV46_MELIC